MKKQISVIAMAVMAATQAQAITANFGWEDGSTVLGQFSASHILHTNSLVQARSGSYSLMVEDVDPIDNSTPQSFLGWVNGLSDGDTVTVSFWVYDESGDRPAGRVWGHYTDDATDVGAYAGSAGGNSTYTDGSGWQQLSHSWTFDSNANSRDGLVIEFRLYDSPDFTTGSLFVDDIEITTTAGTVTLPSGEVISEDSGAGNGGVSGTELFFSEYVEGSSFNKALEIYNPTDSAIDLAASGYTIGRFSNGGTSPTNINLEGSIAANDAFVIAHTSSAAELLAIADQASGSISHNGDDAYVLYKDGVAIDSFGQVGVDPGSAWGSGVSSTANNTLRRLTTVMAGDTTIDDAFDPAQEWEGFGNDAFDDLGSHAGSGGGDNGGGDNGGGSIDLICGADATAIHTIQGSGAATTLSGDHEVEAVVIADFQAGIDGFYLQTAPGEEDADSATSEGIFVYTGNTPQTVNVGDRVRVKASVAEFRDMTQLSTVSALEVCASGQALPDAVDIQLPFATVDSAEAFEGMLVSFNGLTVNDVFNLSRFGSVTLSNGRRMTPTQIAAPGDAANAVAAQNALNAVTLDDGSNAQNPAVVPYPTGGLSASNTLRIGDQASMDAGVLHFSFGEYRIYPTSEVNFVQSNPRTSAPELNAEGNLNIASFNVLNYFNTLNERGADTAEEFTRQRDKIIAAIATLDADIVGLLEVENDGYGADSSIADLVNGLNQAAPGYHWQYVNPGLPQVGTDAIASGIIYRSTAVATVGDTQILTEANSIVGENGEPLFLDHGNRPVVAQKFTLLENGEEMVVAVNHLKAKSRSTTCNAAGDSDKGDGQGHCNLRRTNAAQATGVWLNELFPDSPVIAIGDLNAYAKEDPLAAFADNGFANLFEHLNKGDDVYSFVFFGASGQLDHALANPEMLGKVVDVTEWHINTDEPRALDYNTEFKSDDHILSLYAADPYRSSDHDPVVVSINLEKPFDPNLTDIEIALVEGLSAKSHKSFSKRVTKWQKKIDKWHTKIARLEADIATLDPETKADKIAKKQAEIIQKQAKSVVYQNLIDATLIAIDGPSAEISVARQLMLSDKNEERLLRKQCRMERRSDTEKAAKLEAKAAELLANGKDAQAQKKLDKASALRARAAVYSSLVDVITASLEVE